MPEDPKIAFLDFEASSLNKDGYPIEVAWVLANGEEESHLIRPDPSWTDWDPKAEGVHRISRDRLDAEGTPVADIARRMRSALAGHTLFATAPSWDGKWLSRLLRTAGLPRHALRLQDTEEAHRQVMHDVLQSANVPAELHDKIMKDILLQAQRKDDESGPAEHRALADARRELHLWCDIRRRAQGVAAHFGSAADQAEVNGTPKDSA